MYTAVSRDPIVASDVLARLSDREDGAVLLFLGIVRNHNEGRAVSGMEYEAYEEMADQVLAEITREAGALLGTDRLAVVHRVGTLSIGEPSVAIAVSSPHRSTAYEASRYVIEEIKVRLPVWKREHYTDGERTWLPGHTPEAAKDPGAAAISPTDGTQL